MNTHQPYTKEEHWKAFWRMFYKQKNQGKIIEIPITSRMKEEAKRFSQSIIQEKLKEKHHKSDSNHEWKRWMTGTLGEIALETFLNAEFRDLSIGESKHYDVPDLASIDLRIGVKSFRVGNFPLVNRAKTFPTGQLKPMDGQVFIGISQDLNRAYLLGVAFEEQLLLNEQDPNNNHYVKDINALKRKVAFTKFDSLMSFQSLSELTDLAKENNCLLNQETRKIS